MGVVIAGYGQTEWLVWYEWGDVKSVLMFIRRFLTGIGSLRDTLTSKKGIDVDGWDSENMLLGLQSW